MVDKSHLSNLAGISPVDSPGTNSVLKWNDGYGRGKIGIINCDFNCHCTATSSTWCILLVQSVASQGRNPVTSFKPRKDQHLLTYQFLFPSLPVKRWSAVSPWSCLRL